MDRRNVVDAVVETLEEVTRRQLDDVSERTLLKEDLGLDSTSMIEFVLGLEERVGLEIDFDTLEDMSDFRSVGSVTDYLLTKHE